ncbi:MAG: MMPL family transporter [Actinomycetota bacterium]|jgi:RND superfamily putative drug exporter|nr:MMPL family transporter [Actinomycetota bacterium]
MSAIFGALGRGVVKLRWIILAVWIVGTILAVHAFPSLASQVNDNNSAFLPASAPSNQAAVLAKPLIGSTSQSQVPVVAVTSAPTLTSADGAAVKELTVDLRRVPTVKAATFLGAAPDGRAVQILVLSSVTPFDQTGTKRLVDDLQQAITSATLPANLQVHLSGEVATNVANQKQSNKQGSQIQLFSILFILVLLFAIFRSALAPFITLLGPLFALGLSGSIIGELGAHGLQISFFTQILLIVLLLGAGTDYGLFLVFRVREELLAGRSSHDAVATAMARVGESITASAATVIVALLTLLLASFGIYHDLGVPLAIGIAVMLLAGLTLLPALLAIFGRAAFWPSSTAPRRHGDGLWGRIAGRLVERPATTLCLGIIVFGALSVATFGFKSGGFGGQLTAPAGSDAAKGNAAVSANFPQASANPTNVVMRFPQSVWTDPGPLAVATEGLRRTGKFTSIAGPLDPTGKPVTGAELVALHRELGVPPQELVRTAPIPPAGSPVPAALYDAYVASARYISAAGTTVQWEVGLKAGGPQSNGALQAIPGIRLAVASVAHQAGARASGVAGEAPALYDVSNISGGDLRHIIPVAVLAIGIVLILVLRSLIAPIYLIISVVLSYLASLGLAVVFFMKIGHQGGIVFLLPFLMFIFLLALGEDYNILVMTRIREEAHHRPIRQAVVRAVGMTGPTVTSAGLVLAGSFAVLAIVGGSGASGPDIREIGFGLAVGILLDTFFVRTVLVPSMVALLGRWNWWPSSLGRHVPDVNPSGGGDGTTGGDGPRSGTLDSADATATRPPPSSDALGAVSPIS